MIFVFSGGSELSPDDCLVVTLSCTNGAGTVTAATGMVSGYASRAESSDASMCSFSKASISLSGVQYRQEQLSESAAVQDLLVSLAGLDLRLQDLRSMHDILQHVLQVTEEPSAVDSLSAVTCKTPYSTGPKVWPAAACLCSALLQPRVTNWLRNRTVLELGCGLALPSLTALLAGARSAILTDSGPDVKAVMTAALSTALSEYSRNGCLEFQSLIWGRAGVHDLLSTGKPCPSLVLCCDCVYEPFFGDDSWKQLAETIAGVLCAPQEDVPSAESALQSERAGLLAVEHRMEGLDGVDDFLATLEGLGLRVHSALSDHAGDATTADVGIYWVAQPQVFDSLPL